MAYGSLDTTPGQKSVAIGQAPKDDTWTDPSASYPYRRTADRHADPMPITLHPRSTAAQPGLLDIEMILEDQRQALRQIARSNRLISAPWLIEPPDSESFHKGGGITMPAQDGNFHEVMRITCPPGRNGVMNEIANVVVGGAWADFSGDAIWQIVRNPGNAISAAERNYEDIEASYGLINLPVKISGIRIFENDVLAFLIKNVNLPVAGEKVGALFGGWFYPRTWDDQFDRQDSAQTW